MAKFNVGDIVKIKDQFVAPPNCEAEGMIISLNPYVYLSYYIEWKTNSFNRTNIDSTIIDFYYDLQTPTYSLPVGGTYTQIPINSIQHAYSVVRTDNGTQSHSVQTSDIKEKKDPKDCWHTWVLYQGFNEDYFYCTSCDAKKPKEQE